MLLYLFNPGPPTHSQPTRRQQQRRQIIGAGAYFAALSVILHDETSGDGHPMTPPSAVSDLSRLFACVIRARAELVTLPHGIMGLPIGPVHSQNTRVIS